MAIPVTADLLCGRWSHLCKCLTPDEFLFLMRMGRQYSDAEASEWFETVCCLAGVEPSPINPGGTPNPNLPGGPPGPPPGPGPGQPTLPPVPAPPVLPPGPSPMPVPASGSVWERFKATFCSGSYVKTYERAAWLIAILSTTAGPAVSKKSPLAATAVKVFQTLGGLLSGMVLLCKASTGTVMGEQDFKTFCSILQWMKKGDGFPDWARAISNTALSLLASKDLKPLLQECGV